MQESINNLPHVEESPVTPEEPPEVASGPKGDKLPEGMVDEKPDHAEMQAEVERLKEVKKKAEEDAAYWRRQKAEARADYFRDRDRGDVKPEPPPVVSGVGPEPKAAEFEDYDEYVKKLTDWRVNSARAQWEAESQRKENERSASERQAALREKLQEGYQLYSDFEDVAFDRSASHITPMVVDLLADCDHPAEVVYHLAKNRVEGMAIARMTPLRAARAIAKLEDKIVSNRADNPPPIKPISKAPPPIKTVGSSAAVSKDPEKMSQAEFEAWRISQGATRY